MSKPISELLKEVNAAMAKKEDSSDVETLGAVIGVIAGLVIATVLTLYRGWAFFVLWNWFIAGTIGPIITMSHAIGILLVANMITVHATEPKCGTKLKWSTVLLTPIMAVGIGYLVKVLM